MNRLISTFAAVGVAVLAIPGLALGGNTFGVGGGKTLEGVVKFSFSAHDSPNGPNGYVVEKFTGFGANPPFELEGPVTCLTVIGSHATIGIEIKKGSGSAEPFIGGGFFLFVRDNGEPSDPIMDMFSNSGFFPTPQFGICTPFFEPIFPLTEGNIVVRSD
jgi:hypothetical protein